MTRIYITGTSGGLGSAIKHELEPSLFVEVVDLNLPDYDLEGDLDRFLVDFDVFINCAYSQDAGFAQTELLYRLFEANKHRDCQIINIGSVSADGDRKEVNQYAIHKAALEKACSQLSLIESECRVSLIKPGRMKTRMTDHRSEFYRMDPQHVAKAIVWMMETPKELNVKSLTLDVHNSNRKIK